MPITVSGLCTQEQLQSKPFQHWAERLGLAPDHIHRKVWEWCFITQALYERNLLQPGMSGLGFAVGTEPLTSLFCSLGASISATDLATDVAEQKGWVESNQHASRLEYLNARELCDEEQFQKNCSFRHVDMNNIPGDIGTYDFLWSSCALEHLGSLRFGERFIYNAMNCLNPGGFAVHTTEYNLSSNIFTVGRGKTVLYRRRDIEKIIRNLRKDGHVIDMDFTAGSLPYDKYIDVPPYKHNPHLKLRLGVFTVTSIGLIIQRSR